MEKAKIENKSYLKIIEDKANQQFNIVKIEDDMYLRPAHVLNTYSLKEMLQITDSIIEVNLEKYQELINAIELLEVEDKNFIIARCKRFLEESIVLELMNLSKCFNKTIEVEIYGSFDNYQRKEILSVIAEKVKHKRNIQIIVYVNYTFKMLEALVSN